MRHVITFVLPEEIDEAGKGRRGFVTAIHHGFIFTLRRLTAQQNHGFEGACALHVVHHQIAMLAVGGKNERRHAFCVHFDLAGRARIMKNIRR